MDAFDDESQVPDSQATQLIDHLLDPENRSEGDLRPAPSKSNSNLAVTDSALGSPLNSPSFPTHHFHPLPNTHSLSPACAQNLQPAAQKENLNTSLKITANPQLPPSPSRISLSAPSKASLWSHSLSKISSPKVASASSKPRHSEFHLSNLTRFSRSSLKSSHADSLDQLESGRDNIASKIMSPYSRWARNGLSRSTSFGVVLVESTPSNSSQSQSQSLIETQPLNPSQDPELVGRSNHPTDPMDEGKDGYNSSSSNFDRLESPTVSERYVETQPLNPSQDPELAGHYPYNRYTSSPEFEPTQPLNPSQDPELVGRPSYASHPTDDVKDECNSSSSSFKRLLDSPISSPVLQPTQLLNPSQDPELVGYPYNRYTSSQEYEPTQPLRPSQDPELVGRHLHGSSQGWVETQPLNPSQEYEPTQPLNPSQDPELVGRSSYASHPADDVKDECNSSSSSFKRLLESPVSSPVLEPTQPTTEVNDVTMNFVSDNSLINRLPAHKRFQYEQARAANRKRVQILEQSTCPTGVIDPASNGGVADSAKKRMQQGRSDHPRGLHRTSVIPVERSALNPGAEDTRSCSSEEDDISQPNFSPNKRSAKSYGRRRKVRRLTCSPSPPPSAQPHCVHQDLMEIIPDSDPMQECYPEESFIRKSNTEHVNPIAHARDRESEISREDGVRATSLLKGRRANERTLITQRDEGEEGDKEDGEDDDDDDDDVPLALKRLSKNKSSKSSVAKDVKKKGKPAAVARRVTRGEKPPSSTAIEDSRSKGKGKQKDTNSTRNSGNESPRTEVVDLSTSLPEPNEIPKTKRRPRAANGRKCVSVIPDKEVSQLGEGAAVDMDVDDAQPGTSSRKRKRASTKKSGKTPVVRQSERLRSVTSTVAAGDASKKGTRVFALWRSDGQFYAARVDAHAGGDVFDLSFEDGSASSVSVRQMRSFSLRVGDEVLIGESCEPYDVVGLEHESVNVKNSIGVVTKQKYAEIRIAGKLIEHHWKDRILLMDAIVTAKELMEGKAIATPLREPVPITSSKITSSILEGTCIIVSMSVTNDNGVTEKLNLIKAIESARGYVVDDFSSLLRMEGKHDSSFNRWTINKEDVAWIGSEKIKRLFLVSDDASQKPKYLMALALGVPCLSTDWVDDCILKKQYLKWLGYTLPQGYSTTLLGKATQQVNIEWGQNHRDLTGIMSCRIPCKLFTGWSVLLLGADMVPMPKGRCAKGVKEKAQEANNSLARIVLAMGADRVEAASEPKYVSHHLSDYDLIIIRDDDQYITDLPNDTTVTWGWVKECLIASRELPRPEWDTRFHNLESSQEA